MEFWSDKEVTIGTVNKLKLFCSSISFDNGESSFIKTVTGYVESLNPGILTLVPEQLTKDLISTNRGSLSFYNDGKLHVFEIIGIVSVDNESITFSIAPN